MERTVGARRGVSLPRICRWIWGIIPTSGGEELSARDGVSLPRIYRRVRVSEYMFDLGIQELIVIFVVALIVFGPKRLPELGRTLGKTMGDLRRAMHGVKEQVDSEMRDLKYPVSIDPRVIPTAEKPKEPEAYAPQGAATGEQPSGQGTTAPHTEAPHEQTPHKTTEGSSESGKG